MKSYPHVLLFKRTSLEMERIPELPLLDQMRHRFNLLTGESFDPDDSVKRVHNSTVQITGWVDSARRALKAIYALNDSDKIYKLLTTQTNTQADAPQEFVEITGFSISSDPHLTIYNLCRGGAEALLHTLKNSSKTLVSITSKIDSSNNF